MGRELTDDERMALALRDRRIVARYLGGETQQRIAADYGLSQARIHQILRRGGRTREDGAHVRAVRREVAALSSENL